MEVGSKYSRERGEPFDVGGVYPSVAADAPPKPTEPEPRITSRTVMTLRHTSTELRMNGESRLRGTSLRLDTAAAKLRTAGYELGESG